MPSSNQGAGWCNRCGGPLTSFERGSKLCANCEDEKEDVDRDNAITAVSAVEGSEVSDATNNRFYREKQGDLSSNPPLPALYWYHEFLAWAAHPAENGYVPVHPDTLRTVAKILLEHHRRSDEPSALLLVPCPRCGGTGKLKPYKLEGDTEWRVADCPEKHVTAEPPVDDLLTKYEAWIETIALGQEDRQHGSSAYNWHRAALTQLRRLAVTKSALPCVWRDGCRAPEVCAAKGHCDAPTLQQNEAWKAVETGDVRE